ncbi:unnamed protein product [Prorocentrum cordatum]|uniref:Uncharacterized protein n=1 Tax=Prorocentrum cordatum TaxID=2364126 RepID=A0ABN9TM16_9DINO|nr:unnamed protein product [Polarella glacialis]
MAFRRRRRPLACDALLTDSPDLLQASGHQLKPCSSSATRELWGKAPHRAAQAAALARGKTQMRRRRRRRGNSSRAAARWPAALPSGWLLGPGRGQCEAQEGRPGPAGGGRQAIKRKWGRVDLGVDADGERARARCAERPADHSAAPAADGRAEGGAAPPQQRLLRSAALAHSSAAAANPDRQAPTAQRGAGTDAHDASSSTRPPSPRPTRLRRQAGRQSPPTPRSTTSASLLPNCSRRPQARLRAPLRTLATLSPQPCPSPRPRGHDSHCPSPQPCPSPRPRGRDSHCPSPHRVRRLGHAAAARAAHDDLEAVSDELLRLRGVLEPGCLGHRYEAWVRAAGRLRVRAAPHELSGGPVLFPVVRDLTIVWPHRCAIKAHVLSA